MKYFIIFIFSINFAYATHNNFASENDILKSNINFISVSSYTIKQACEELELDVCYLFAQYDKNGNELLFKDPETHKPIGGVLTENPILKAAKEARIADKLLDKTVRDKVKKEKLLDEWKKAKNISGLSQEEKAKIQEIINELNVLEAK